jgi:hypothetical protein
VFRQCQRLRLAYAVGFACAASASVLGCLLTSDFANLSGGATDAGTDAEARDVAVADAPVEAAARFCVGSEHILCADFDDTDGKFPVPTWADTARSGALLLDNGTFTSPPWALNAKLEADSQAPAAIVNRSAFLGEYSAIVLSFDFRLTRCPTSGNSVTLMGLRFPGTSFGFIVSSSGNQAVGTSVGDVSTFANLFPQIQANVWSRIVFRVSIKSPTLAGVSVTVDGQLSAESDFLSGVVGPAVELQFGGIATRSPRGCEVAFDNVTLDKE